MKNQLFRDCVVIGGSGAVGSMFIDLLASTGAEVCVIDTVAPAATIPFEPGDITRPTSRILAILNKADLVLLAIPERVALAVLKPVTSAMRADTLLVHTLSVQSRAATVVKNADIHIEVVGLNPMFSPALGIAGRPIAAIAINDGPLTSKLLYLITSWGGKVVRLGAEEHDQFCAATQALTHATVLAFGMALVNLGIDIHLLSSLAPPPHTTLLALLARIISGNPEVYWDIQSANSQAGVARAALASGIGQFKAATEDEKAFLEMLHRVREVLGNELEMYRDICTQIFSERLVLPTRPSQEEDI